MSVPWVARAAKARNDATVKIEISSSSTMYKLQVQIQHHVEPHIGPATSDMHYHCIIGMCGMGLLSTESPS